MKNYAKIIVAVVVVAVIGLGAMLLSGKKTDQTSNTTSDTGAAESDQSAPAAATITYDSNGFSPSTVTISSGQAVKFMNNSDAEIEPSSSPHPVHTDNPELNIGDIEPGSSTTVTLTSKGTWGYHNHYQTDDRGEITVE